MRCTSMIRLLAFTGAVLLAEGGFTPARAQDPDDLKRGVARISLMNGEVSVRRGDTSDWVAGVINAPLLTDDRVATGPNSRSEVQFDSSNMLRLGANAELRLTQLENNRFQMELARGVVTYRVRLRLDSAELKARMRTNQPVDPDSQGVVEVEIGLFDGLIRRQTLEVVEPADPFSGTGLDAARTTYSIEYWDHDRHLEVREPK